MYYLKGTICFQIPTGKTPREPLELPSLSLSICLFPGDTRLFGVLQPPSQRGTRQKIYGGVGEHQ